LRAEIQEKLAKRQIALREMPKHPLFYQALRLMALSGHGKASGLHESLRRARERVALGKSGPQRVLVQGNLLKRLA
jgi:hypothetical protein